MLAPMCLADRDKAWRFAAVTTITSLLGGIAGYAIGYFLFESVEPWLRDSHYWSAYLQGKDWFANWGVWAVLIAGFFADPVQNFHDNGGCRNAELSGLRRRLSGRSRRAFFSGCRPDPGRRRTLRGVDTALRRTDRLGRGCYCRGRYDLYQFFVSNAVSANAGGSPCGNQATHIGCSSRPHVQFLR